MSKKQVITLYKQLLEKASNFSNYNFREYAKRRIRDQFRESKGITSEEKITELYSEGLKQLAMLKRQSVISQMYTFDKLVVEPLNKHH